jgi:hypothetical protein
MTEPKKKRNLNYSPHLITYIDILGFRELVEEKSPNFISRAIRKVIETTAPDAEIRRINEENFVSFSDLIVHTIPVLSKTNIRYRDGLVFLEINHLAHAQAELIGEGLLIRGALTLGMLERTYGVLFGPGIISAYEMEHNEAQFPRVVVDPDLVEALRDTPLLRAHGYDEEMEYISKYLRRDDDGVIFIDYLGGMQDEVSEYAEYLDFVQVHKSLIEEKIEKFKNNKRVLSKYLWLKKYHNAVVQTRLRPEFHKGLLVTVYEVPAVPPLSPVIRPVTRVVTDGG